MTGVMARRVERTFRIASTLDSSEAQPVDRALRRAGWRPAEDGPPRLHWVDRYEGATGQDEAIALDSHQLVNRIPGLGILRRRDLVTAGIRRARERLSPGGSGASDSTAAGLLDTFVIPADAERWGRQRAAASSRRWIQRPSVTTVGAPEMEVVGDWRVDGDSQWVLQPALARPDSRDQPMTVRTLALVAALEPLVVYALDTALCDVSAERGGPLSDDARPLLGTLTEPTEPSDVSASGARLGAMLARLAGEALLGIRELLLRRVAERGHPLGRHFQVIGLSALLDEGFRPWFLEIDTSPLRHWRFLPELGDTYLAAVIDAIDRVDPLGLAAPNRVGPFSRVVPACPPDTARSGLALARPADIALDEALGAPRRPAPQLEPAPDLHHWFLGSNLVLHVASQADLQVFNAVGAFIWAALQDGLDVDETAAELVATTADPIDAVCDLVRATLGEWVDAGALIHAGSAGPRAPHVDAEAASLQLRYVRWNADRVYSCLGSSVLVRAPSRELCAWVERGLVGLADAAPAEIAAVIEVTRDGGGWRLSSTHQPSSRIATAHQLPPAVRAAVLAAAARTCQAPAFHGSALEVDGRVAVIIGSIESRAALLTAWVASGGRVLADELLGVDADLRVRPSLAGMELRATYQWIDGPPAAWGSQHAPMVDAAGFLVQYRFAAAATTSAHPTATQAFVVGGGTPGEPARSIEAGEVLAVLMTQRVRGVSAMFEPEVEATLRWLASAPCWQISLDDARVAAVNLRILASTGRRNGAGTHGEAG